MGFFQQLQQQTETARQHVLSAPVLGAVPEGRFNVEGYRYFLAQAYHHVKHTVPLMMACGARLPEHLESVRAALVEYIAEENGHHEWILNDIEAAGGDRRVVQHSKPCLAIELMVAFLYDQINRGNPVAFFGMVMVLEGASVQLATQMGQIVQEKLALPAKAFSYLYSHGNLDLEHFRFFENLMDQISDSADQAAIVHAAEVVYQLYGDMLHSIPLLSAKGDEVQHAAA